MQSSKARGSKARDTRLEGLRLEIQGSKARGLEARRLDIYNTPLNHDYHLRDHIESNFNPTFLN